jgi:hypothetical protein
MDEIVTSSDPGCEVSSVENDQLKTNGMRAVERSHLNVIVILTLLGWKPNSSFA